MVDKGVEYTVRDFSAVDTQVAEMAKREKLLTWRLRIENLKRLGMPLYISQPPSNCYHRSGYLFLAYSKERVVEVDKVVEVVKEVPVATEKLKIVEVPVYVETPVEKVVEVTKEVPVVSEKLKIVEVPVYVETSPAQGNSSILNIQVSDSLEVSKLKKKLALLLVLIIQATAVLVLIRTSIHLERYIADLGKMVFQKEMANLHSKMDCRLMELGRRKITKT